MELISPIGLKDQIDLIDQIDLVGLITLIDLIDLTDLREQLQRELMQNQKDSVWGYSLVSYFSRQAHLANRIL